MKGLIWDLLVLGVWGDARAMVTTTPSVRLGKARPQFYNKLTVLSHFYFIKRVNVPSVGLGKARA